MRLGYDLEGNVYVYFPQFCGDDVRVYRQRQHILPKEWDNVPGGDEIENLLGKPIVIAPVKQENLTTLEDANHNCEDRHLEYEIKDTINEILKEVENRLNNYTGLSTDHFNENNIKSKNIIKLDSQESMFSLDDEAYSQQSTLFSQDDVSQSSLDSTAMESEIEDAKSSQSNPQAVKQKSDNCKCKQTINVFSLA